MTYVCTQSATDVFINDIYVCTQSAADEVGFNTPGDLVYFQVPDNFRINTGIIYKMRDTDYLSEVAQRFGMRMTSLMALNPDIVRENQDSSMSGKEVCILQQVRVCIWMFVCVCVCVPIMSVRTNAGICWGRNFAYSACDSMRVDGYTCVCVCVQI
jgi:hypothetical protein